MDAGPCGADSPRCAGRSGWDRAKPTMPSMRQWRSSTERSCGAPTSGWSMPCKRRGRGGRTGLGRCEVYGDHHTQRVETGSPQPGSLAGQACHVPAGSHPALLAVGALVLVLAAGGVGWYFYAVKANQPMQIDPRFARTLPPEGMTFREFWQDRFAGWEKIDEARYESRSFEKRCTCRFQDALFRLSKFCPFLRVYFVRTQPGTAEAESWIRGAKGIIAPDDLPFLDAWWWQIENESWWAWVTALGRPCQLPPPQRPAATP
ncbi:MAG: hypothetical protein KatS3mg047_1510 [Bellilinea sp.]|nr:MAG: hypothetical protein KatS3mg047_1510 [Bellilinea sp.]